MSITEIILLILGIVIFIVSFLVPSGNEKKEKDLEESEKLKEAEMQELFERKMQEAKEKIHDIVEETVSYSMEKSERSMERITNEKIMAVNEYSGTVLEQIEKNHKETVFLYDMLNEKQEGLKQAVSEAARKTEELNKAVQMDFKPILVEKTDLSQYERPEEPAPEKKEARRQPPLSPEENKEVQGSSQPEKEQAQEADLLSAPLKEEKPKKRRTRPAASQKAQKEEKEQALSHRKEQTLPHSEEKAREVALSMTASEDEDSQNNNQRILELHKQGKSNMTIAKELGLGIGEVKLVIDLFKGI